MISTIVGIFCCIIIYIALIISWITLPFMLLLQIVPAIIFAPFMLLIWLFDWFLDRKSPTIQKTPPINKIETEISLTGSMGTGREEIQKLLEAQEMGYFKNKT